MKIEFYRHNLGEKEKKLVVESLESIFLTTGPKTNEFENKFSEYLGVKHCVGVSSCTSGLHIVLKALGIEPNDEVITSPMSFIATSNAIIYNGAKPVFVDVEKDTGNIDVNKIEEKINRKTKAIIPVHLYGQMCDMKKINQIAKKYNIFVIEDSAHCIEGERDYIKPGQLSDAAVFSFYATKNITSGEGGAIITNNSELDSLLRKYRLHGMSKDAANRYTGTYQHWDMELLGYKCNMYDIQASLLIPQLEKIEEYLKIKEEICKKYEEAFSKINGIDYPKILPNTKHARQIFTIWVSSEKRDIIIKKLQESQIGVAVNFRAIHLLKYYKETFNFKRGNYPEAERIGDSTITLPMYPKLKNEEINYVIDKVKESIY